MEMKIDETTWQAIIAETKAAVEKLNASAVRIGSKQKFGIKVPDPAPDAKYAYLITSDGDGDNYAQRKVLARELASGEMRPAKIVKMKGGRGAKIAGADPKAWAKLVGKSAAEIVKGTGIATYQVFSFSVSPREPEVPVPGRPRQAIVGNKRYAILEQRAGRTGSWVSKYDSMSSMTTMAMGRPGEDFEYSDRDVAERDAQEYRDRDARFVERDARKRVNKHQPHTYTVIEITEDTEAEYRAKFRAGITQAPPTLGLR
jgi:hypothetical protein